MSDNFIVFDALFYVLEHVSTLKWGRCFQISVIQALVLLSHVV